ncbi:hypothetical protein OTU49_004398 [Cherax quadricarinatus]|uniref:Uncharacterized protein n=2 Tax=Cherax quadricarinatus TaxID=27406 RepID=A0AAW0YPB4_CHEQU
MARGRGRGRKAAAKRKTDDDGEPPAKLQREDSTNTKLRKAIQEAKKSASQLNKPRKIKPDQVLLRSFTNASVYEDYACMLNQTNIGNNNNKFYIIQVNEDAGRYICFTRWGRVGEEGQSNSDCSKEVEAAIKSFKKKFKDKTKNDWDNRDNFTPHPGKYTLIEIDEDDDDEEEDNDAVDGVEPSRQLVTFTGSCSLPYRTQLMIKLIFSDDMFVNQMSHMKLDVKKMPLGKLSKQQIAKGLEALMDIEEAIKKNKPRKVLMELSSKFFTLVPHNFGRSVPPVIADDSVVQEKKEVMLTLSDIELTQSLQKDKSKKDIHPLLEKYEMLECVLSLLDKKSEEFKMLQTYSTACPNTRKGPLLDAWRVDRKGEKTQICQP